MTEVYLVKTAVGYVGQYGNGLDDSFQEESEAYEFDSLEEAEYIANLFGGQIV